MEQKVIFPETEENLYKNTTVRHEMIIGDSGFAQLMDDGKCINCFVAEEIIIEDDIKFHSDSENEVKEFCEKWNRELKYYTYEEVKKLKKGTHLIVLLTVIGNELIGLAQQDNSYKIKDNGIYIYEKYNFLVCTKVIGAKEEYLLPIGYSDEEQWIEQESECKKQIIKNNNKSNDKEEILQICKSIKDTNNNICWHNILEMIEEDYEEMEDIKDYREENFMLYKVIERCYKEDFPIQEYKLFQIPYSDEKGCIIEFVHGEDNDNYHIKGMKDIKIREIDFWVERNGEAIPQLYNPENGEQSNAADCKSAVWK